MTQGGYCGRCGAPWTAGQRFCESCGGPVGVAAAQSGGAPPAGQYNPPDAGYGPTGSLPAQPQPAPPPRQSGGSNTCCAIALIVGALLVMCVIAGVALFIIATLLLGEPVPSYTDFFPA
jgi:hypothetical protein